MQRMKLGVIIVSWNVNRHLKLCLDSLQRVFQTPATRQVLSGDPIVIVVDNASEDGSVEMVKVSHPWVKLFASQENMGYVKGNNYCIQHLLHLSNDKPDAIWLLNPDTVVHGNAVTKLIWFLLQNPNAGLIGPALCNTDGSFQDSAFRFPGLMQPLFDFKLLPERLYFSALNGRYHRHLYENKKPFKVGHPLGAAMLARTETIEKIGLLDDQFFMYCEEIDWAWRMKQSGWERWIVPEALVTHHGGASTRQSKPKTTTYLWESRARLYHKYSNDLVYMVVSYLVRRHFSNQTPASEDWRMAYRNIIAAWKSPRKK
ncbi:MAG: glycosyltransferase family 2 protein [Anaerolineae bacterium]|nr:glycosyltransferase family 2 protein [Anaerolineae bacterium]